MQGSSTTSCCGARPSPPLHSVDRIEQTISILRELVGLANRPVVEARAESAGHRSSFFRVSQEISEISSQVIWTAHGAAMTRGPPPLEPLDCGDSHAVLRSLSRGLVVQVSALPMEVEESTRVVNRRLDPSEPVTPRPAPQVLTPSLDQIGRYQPVRRLGHGGMATVYLARALGAEGFERLVALKVIHPHLVSEPELVQMFLDEARIAARIHHPNVVEIIDLGREGERLYMVMEYVEGDTVASLLRHLKKSSRFLPLPGVLQILADACEGLAAAHALEDREGRPFELVHRDISPHNLLLSMTGLTKIVDFGIMKAAGKPSTTETGHLRGKFAYMSPEQAKGAEVDLRTDLFALGVVLWELLVNEKLFGAISDPGILERVACCELPDLEQIRPGLPASVHEIVARSLARDPSDRYASARDMLRDVRAAMRSLGDSEDARELLCGEIRDAFAIRVAYLRASAAQPGGDEEATSSKPRLEVIENEASTSGRKVLTGTGPTTAPQRPTWPRWIGWFLLVGFAGFGVVVGYWDATPPAPLTARMALPLRVLVSKPSFAGGEPLPTHVTWWFNTQPQGAQIEIDGQVLAQPTPVSIELSRGATAIPVRVRKAGYREHELELAPVASENHTFELEPSPRPEPATAAPEKVRPPTKRPRFQARMRASTPSSQALVSEDTRQLEQLPDFDESRRQESEP